MPLANELKAAGFPQGVGGPHPLIPYAPTLSELIEECGNIDFALEHDAGEGNWEASTPEQGVWWVSEGKSPTEAVARLWLALNKTTST